MPPRRAPAREAPSIAVRGCAGVHGGLYSVCSVKLPPGAARCGGSKEATVGIVPEESTRMKRWTLSLLALAVAGCTTYKLWTETDSDERAGMIQLSYEYRRFENPQVDERGGIEMAKERCIG